MPVLLLALLVSVLVWLWLVRRGSSLTRVCRWRQDRSLGPTVWRCAACGAQSDPGPADQPRSCLRDWRKS